MLLEVREKNTQTHSLQILHLITGFSFYAILLQPQECPVLQSYCQQVSAVLKYQDV